ncbi:hypothetical protein HETIRDRAFT_308576, partial [Heterobasidion irregulare TC 32-1]
SLRCTTHDGKAVFLKKKTRKHDHSSVRLSTTQCCILTTAHHSFQINLSGQRMTNLLDVPIHRLMDELSLKTASKISEQELVQAAGLNAASISTAKPKDTLWVDRYRPKRFTELLGDERLHREVMAWVKEWDPCVFGVRKNKKRPRDEEETYLPPDPFHRPREKILLLSGPPGLGKTTLAHIVAKHAGYNVFEINASDARSGQVVDDRIRPAAEAGFAVGSAKPNLIVIDEIDGATGGGDNAAGFIYKLTQLAMERPHQERPGKKKDPKGKRPLLRPIICICNDLYASSLAKLRPLARIVRFTRPADVHVVRRLRDICEREGLKADSRALSTLVGVAMGDLRGCLNTLQFIKARNQDVTEPLIRTATKGMKEADSSLTNALNSLFLPMTKRRVKELGVNEEEGTKYVDRICRELEGSGALDRVALGCFEHYPSLHRHDATFARYIKAEEWLVAYDMLSGSMRAEREYALLPYLAYTLVAFHPLFQERGGARVERPKADWENHMRTRANEEIGRALALAVRAGNGHLAGHHRHLVSGDVLHLEFAPYINRIIAPPLRPVNSQVIRPEEKAVLARLVGIMVSLELRFVQEKAEDGQLVYRLDPPIDVFVTYDGKRAMDIAASRYAVRHLVAAEIDAQLIARQAESAERNKAQASRSFFGARSGALPTEDAARARPRKRAKVSAAAASIDIADKPPVDFFGRPIAATSKKAPPTETMTEAVAVAATTTTTTTTCRVSYKFREGNSAAVRKPVKVASFL